MILPSPMPPLWSTGLYLPIALQILSLSSSSRSYKCSFRASERKATQKKLKRHPHMSVDLRLVLQIIRLLPTQDQERLPSWMTSRMVRAHTYPPITLLRLGDGIWSHSEDSRLRPRPCSRLMVGMECSLDLITQFLAPEMGRMVGEDLGAEMDICHPLAHLLVHDSIPSGLIFLILCVQPLAGDPEEGIPANPTMTNSCHLEQ